MRPGVAYLNVELAAKHLELLHELAPAATLVALLVNPANPFAEVQTRELQNCDPLPEMAQPGPAARSTNVRC